MNEDIILFWLMFDWINFGDFYNFEKKTDIWVNRNSKIIDHL